MLYPSENSSLAYLENLVHFDAAIIPTKWFITEIGGVGKPELIYTLPVDGRLIPIKIAK